MRRLLPALGLLLAVSASQAQSVDEYAVLVSGDTLRGDVDIREPFLRSTRIVVNDSAEYKLDQITEVNNASGNYVVGHGSAFGGTMLVERVEAGRISLYEKVTQNHGTWMPGPNGTQQYTGGGTSKSQFFRLQGGPVQRASAANLRAAMQDSPASIALLDRRERLAYVQWGLVGVGAVVTVLGLTQSEFGEPASDNPFANDEGEAASISPLVFVGVGVMAGSWIPHLMREPLLEESIDVYNRER